MNNEEINRSLCEHARSYFAGHNVSERQWKDGPILELLPQFRVLEIGPGPRNNLWTYTSVGTWEVQHEDTGLVEFMIIAEKQNLRHVKLLAMNAVYYMDHILQLGDTYPIGAPWVRGSRCDHMLVSLPYPYGPDWEICNFADGHIHIYWLLPITSAEHDYKIEHGVEALEALFEKKGLEYWKIHRKSVV